VRAPSLSSCAHRCLFPQPRSSSCNPHTLLLAMQLNARACTHTRAQSLDPAKHTHTPTPRLIVSFHCIFFVEVTNYYKLNRVTIHPAGQSQSEGQLAHSQQLTLRATACAGCKHREQTTRRVIVSEKFRSGHHKSLKIPRLHFPNLAVKAAAMDTIMTTLSGMHIGTAVLGGFLLILSRNVLRGPRSANAEGNNEVRGCVASPATRQWPCGALVLATSCSASLWAPTCMRPPLTHN
jgi:hypothetical protein